MNLVDYFITKIYYTNEILTFLLTIVVLLIFLNKEVCRLNEITVSEYKKVGFSFTLHLKTQIFPNLNINFASPVTNCSNIIYAFFLIGWNISHSIKPNNVSYITAKLIKNVK